MSDVVELTKDNFKTELEQSPMPVLVDFFAEWCGPCKMMEPALEELATEKQGTVKIARVDCDQDAELAGQFGITSIPCLILFRNGAEVDRMIGASPKDQLASWLDEKAG